MDISSPSKLGLRISATLQAPVQDKKELPLCNLSFSSVVLCSLHFFKHATAAISTCCKQNLWRDLSMAGMEETIGKGGF